MKMKKIANVLFIACVALIIGCPKPVVVTPVPPVVTDQNVCVDACANLQKLGCKEGDPIDMGTRCDAFGNCKDVYGQTDASQTCDATTNKCMTSCANFCVAVENQGVWLDPTCVSKITACSQIESCPLAQPKQPTNTCTGRACSIRK